MTDTANIRNWMRTAAEIRRAADLIDIPAIILEATDAEIPARIIARDLNITEGYVHRIIRRRDTEHIVAAGVANDPDPRKSLERWTALLDNDPSHPAQDFLTILAEAVKQHERASNDQ